MTEAPSGEDDLLAELFKERPALEASERKFFELLPHLLQQFRGQWVAVAGDRVFPVRKSKSQARAEAEKANIPFGEYTVRLIEEIDTGD